MIETPIDGLTISLQKFVTDDRGTLYELLPEGTKNGLIFDGKIGNIYASKAVRKFVPRAGHYHKNLVENFFTISGTVLWYFEDFREDSKTFRKSFEFTCGEAKTPPIPRVVNVCFDTDGMAQVRVPIGVYHLYFPLTDSPALVLAVGSLPYDSTDYVCPISDKSAILRKWINVEEKRGKVS